MTTSTHDLGRSQEVVFFPASFAQQSLWFIDQLTPGKATYNIDCALRIRGKLEIELLRRALEEVARRHETLRTRLVVVRGELQQVIEDQVNVRLPILDLSSIAGGREREAEAMQVAQKESQRAFDLQQAPLFRGKLLRLSPLDHMLLFTMHHIISDAWSIGILIEEVSILYEAFSAGRPSPLPELPIQYADYSVWQRHCLEKGLLEPQLSYWKQQLAGTSVLALPADRPRPAEQSQHGATRDFVIAADIARKLKKLAEDQGATLFMALLAAFQTQLYRYSGQTEIAVGTPVAGRRNSATEKLIGFFINTLVLRVDLSGAPSFLDLLQRTKEVTLEAYAHQDVPFEKLVEVLAPERNLGSTPLFQVMMTLQNAPVSDLRLGSAALSPFNIDNGTSKFDLRLQIAEDGSGPLVGSVQYSTDLFDASSISRMTDHYQMLLIGIVANPNQSIALLHLLTANERTQVLEEWNRTEREIPAGTLVDLFTAQAQRTPDAMAVAHREEKLSYRELNERANQLAWRLRELGVGPESRVGLMVARSIEMVVGLLAVLKAGAAYVPLDPSSPVERLKHMMEDSEARLVLSSKSLAANVELEDRAVLLMEAEEWRSYSKEELRIPIDPARLAYVIYTSGSTGRPKGVEVEHRQLMNYIWAIGEKLQIEPGMRLALVSTPAADLGYTMIFPSLCYGGCLDVIDADWVLDPGKLAEHFSRHPVDYLKIVPSHLRALLNSSEGSGLLPRRWLVLGGEASSWDFIQQVKEAGRNCRVLNHYGPTETTVGVLTYDTTQNDGRKQRNGMVPVGRPLSNAKAYVLDSEFNPVGVGITGEIHIGGAGVARGYWKRAELTAEKFVPDPYSVEPGGRMYRTGDLGRYLESGNIEFLGRKDQQVKIRGFRIELGEIEAALQEHEGVRQAVVIAQEDESGDKQLVAYLVAEEESGTSSNGSNGSVRGGQGSNEWREHLLGKLPEYMVPSAYVELERLPLNPNGKLDRKKLPRAEQERTREEEYVGPRNETEETLCRLWEEVLRRERVGIHDNFFKTGGHSLRAVQLISRVRTVFAIDMPLAVLFSVPTVARMAEHITALKGDERLGSEASPILVNIQSHGMSAPFFCVHAIGGEVISFGELSQELGMEQPFYGLQSPPAHFFGKADITIGQLATLYNREIRSVQPNGPYMLGGWSMGGLVAWEMAQQLVKEGHTVGLLALIDTTPPSRYLEAEDKANDLSMLARFALNMSGLAGRDPGPLVERFSQASEQDQWKMVEESLVSYGGLAPHTAHADMTALLDVFARNFLAMNNYSLHHSKQPVVFFRAAETPERFSRLWNTWAGGGIQFHSVPGDHFTMLRRPNAGVIGEILRRYMRKQQHSIASDQSGNEAHSMSALTS
jgi:amino acid adenylation domain-containing protein